MRNKSTSRRALTLVAILTVALFGLSTVSAKSLYCAADHHSRAFQAWNVNPDGTVTWQATYTLAYSTDPAGIAIDNDSETLFITSEFSGGVELVDPVTLTYLGVSSGPSNLAGIDVDDVNDIVYAVRRYTNELYIYSWDPVALTLTQTNLVYLPGMSGAFGLALDEFRGILWIADTPAGMVRAYDTTTFLEDTTLSFAPSHKPVDVAVDRTRNIVYSVSMIGGAWLPPGTGSHLLSKWDVPSTTESVVDMGHAGVGLAVDETTGYVYVTGGAYAGDNLCVWNTSTSPFTELQDTGRIGNPAGLAIGNVSFNPLNLTKSDGLDEGACMVAGATYAYSACFDNLENLFAVDNVVIVDDLPPVVSFVSATDGGVYDSFAHRVTWTMGSMEPGASQYCLGVTVRLDPAAEPDSTFTNFATIDSDQTPPTTVSMDTSVCPFLPVYFDIKPGSCPNPFNVKSKGDLPVAILGTPDFDVLTIDPMTVMLAMAPGEPGVYALRWAWEDVGTPYEGDMCGCHTLGPDGMLDLTLKFDRQECVAEFGLEGYLGETMPMVVMGNLASDSDAPGMPILGQDCSWIK